MRSTCQLVDDLNIYITYLFFNLILILVFFASSWFVDIVAALAACCHLFAR